jgi:hypothetical protein
MQHSVAARIQLLTLANCPGQSFIPGKPKSPRATPRTMSFYVRRRLLQIRSHMLVLTLSTASASL